MTTDQRKLEECAQAQWHEISIAYETEPEKRTDRQEDLASSGLCNASGSMGIGYQLPNAIAGDLIFDFWWPTRRYDDDHTRQHDLYRATFAAFMAALSAKDIREMLNEN